MSKKIGRPKTPKSKAKTNFRAAFFATDEARLIDRAAITSGLDKSKWLRDVALEAARPIWNVVKRWTYADLQAKTVEFRLIVAGTPISGTGFFSVMQHRFEPVVLAIEIQSIEPDGSGLRWRRVFLTQNQSDKIEKHRNASVAVFQCLE